MPAKSLRYFLYVSDAKVDMLLAQIPAKLKDKIAVSLEIDLKVISTTLSPKEAKENRFSRLEAVVAYFDENMEVGTVDEPQAYFKGEMDMWWDVFPQNGVVYFGGDTGATALGMGGSAGYLVGGHGPREGEYFSVGPVLSRAIAEIVDSEEEPQEAIPGYEPRFILMMNNSSHPLPERVEFLARRLQVSPPIPYEMGDPSPTERQVVLGSPIFVAMSD